MSAIGICSMLRAAAAGWCIMAGVMNLRLCFGVVALAAALVLGGCGPAVVGAGFAGGAVASDSRTPGSIVEDETIEQKMRYAVNRAFGDKVNISVTSYNRIVLLTGQAPNEKIRAEVVALAKKVENARSVHDKITIGGAASLSSRTADSLLTARVKTSLCLLQIEGFSCLPVKVVSESGVVYLLGLLTRENAAIAVREVRKIKGVLKVVRVLQYRAE